MIILGVALILFFFVVGYVAILQEGRSPGQKFRGPVKDPRSGMSPKSEALVSFSANDRIKNGCKISAVFEGMPQVPHGAGLQEVSPGIIAHPVQASMRL